MDNIHAWLYDRCCEPVLYQMWRSLPPGAGRFAPRRDLLLPPGKSRQKLA